MNLERTNKAACAELAGGEQMRNSKVLAVQALGVSLALILTCSCSSVTSKDDGRTTPGMSPRALVELDSGEKLSGDLGSLRFYQSGTAGVAVVEIAVVAASSTGEETVAIHMRSPCGQLITTSYDTSASEDSTLNLEVRYAGFRHSAGFVKLTTVEREWVQGTFQADSQDAPPVSGKFTAPVSLLCYPTESTVTGGVGGGPDEGLETDFCRTSVAAAFGD